MTKAIYEIFNIAQHRLRRVIRVSRFYNSSGVMRLYKSEVLSYIETFAPAVLHAAGSLLALLDGIQSSFLSTLGISDERALLDYRLAPLNCRRQIAVLGLPHRVALGLAPTSLASLFPRARSDMHTLGWSTSTCHPLRLHDPVGPRERTILKRSAFGMIQVYNGLPAEVVGKKNLKSFQQCLHNMLRDRVDQRSESWQQTFSRR